MESQVPQFARQMPGGVTPKRFADATAHRNRRPRTRRPLMLPTSLCIVARYMSRSYERARITSVLSVMLVALTVLGCT